MSWFSPVTGNALFVNQRGQRVGEHSLDSLARMMAKDQVRVVTAQRAGLVDRAWNAALNALRTLTGRREDEQDEDPPVEAAAAPSPRPRVAEAPAPSASPPRPQPPPSSPKPHETEPPIGLIGDESAMHPLSVRARAAAAAQARAAASSTPSPSPFAKPPAPMPPSSSPAPARPATSSAADPSPFGLIGDESAPPPTGGSKP